MKRTKKAVLAAILDSGGIKKNIAEKLDVQRHTLDSWLAADPELQAALLDEKEKLKDLSEERLVEQIQMGNLGAIIWYQKTQCRDRGYVEKVEQVHSGSEESPLVVRMLKRPDLSSLSEEELIQLESLLGKTGAATDA